MIVIFAITWVICGVLGAGFLYSETRHKFPETPVRVDVGECMLFVPFGMLIFVLSYFSTGFGMYGCWGIGGKRGHNGKL